MPKIKQIKNPYLNAQNKTTYNFHHECLKAHFEKRSDEKIRSLGRQGFLHLPYSTDLTPAGFHLF